MSIAAILSFNQTTKTNGVLNTIDLVHPAVHHYPAGTVKLEFLHVGVESLAEPRVLDGYLFGVLHFLMGGAQKLQIEGPVSVKAIRNANLLAEAWHAWVPGSYRPIEIIAEKVLDQPTFILPDDTHRDRAIAAFSGGLDSTFTVLRHAHKLLGNASYNIEDLVMIHGFDVSLNKEKDFDELRRRVEPFVDELGLNLRIVRTNIKDAIANNWEHVFAAQLASVLHQFSPEFGYGLMASGAVLTEPDIRWGSTPQLDYLLSGSDFEIVHDGAAFSRTDKAALIAKYPAARRSVKVCWQGVHQGRNCGHCEKCIRTRLNFRAAGVSNPECFDSPFDLSMVDGIEVTNVAQLNLLKVIIDEGQLSQKDSEWLIRLKQRVAQLEAELITTAQSGNFQATLESKKPEDVESIAEIESELTCMTSHMFNQHTLNITFKQRLDSHRHAIASFLRQTPPLWLLTEIPGNIGDHLIWAGTERLLLLSGLSFERLPMAKLQLDKYERAGTLIVPGNAAFTSRWHEWLPDLVIAHATHFDRVVVLPSSFDPELPVVAKALQQSNVYAFAREAYSYNKIKGICRAALAPDPALWAMDFEPKVPLFPTNDNFVATNGQSESGTQTNNNPTSNTADRTVLALRTDAGSLLPGLGLTPAAHNNDISLTCQNLDEFMQAIGEAKSVVTDRLHAVVAAVMLGKQVDFIDPYDQKISRYIAANFGSDFQDLLTPRSIRWLLEHHHIEPSR